MRRHPLIHSKVEYEDNFGHVCELPTHDEVVAIRNAGVPPEAQRLANAGLQVALHLLEYDQYLTPTVGAIDASSLDPFD